MFGVVGQLGAFLDVCLAWQVNSGTVSGLKVSSTFGTDASLANTRLFVGWDASGARI